MTEVTRSAARYSTPSTSNPIDTAKVAEIEWRMDVAESLRRLGDQQHEVVAIVERLAARPYRVPTPQPQASPRAIFGIPLVLLITSVIWFFDGILIGVAVS